MRKRERERERGEGFTWEFGFAVPAMISPVQGDACSGAKTHTWRAEGRRAERHPWVHGHRVAGELRGAPGCRGRPSHAEHSCASAYSACVPRLCEAEEAGRGRTRGQTHKSSAEDNCKSPPRGPRALRGCPPGTICSWTPRQVGAAPLPRCRNIYLILQHCFQDD